MPLMPLDLPADPTPIPANLADFLSAIAYEVDDWFRQPERVRGRGFVPSDYEAVFQTLRALRQREPDLRTFLEWGSGFGAVTGIAALLGFNAHGIEIERDLVAASRRLLAEHEVRAKIACGSFLPEDPELRELVADLAGYTAGTGEAGYDELGMDPEDFEVVFAFPWPGEEQRFHELFLRTADFGAVLVTFHAREGMRAYRKVSRRNDR